MIKPKYNIGDEVWVGRWEPREEFVTCPDCGGTRAMKLTLFDGTEYIVECEGCKHGWEGSRGYNKVVRYSAYVEILTISGLEISSCGRSGDPQIEYRGELSRGTCYTFPENEVFDNKEAALFYAVAKGRQLEIDQEARLYLKEKPAKSWSYHVSYYRQKIKQAKEDLAIYQRKLGIAREKTKLR